MKRVDVGSFQASNPARMIQNAHVADISEIATDTLERLKIRGENPSAHLSNRDLSRPRLFFFRLAATGWPLRAAERRLSVLPPEL